MYSRRILCLRELLANVPDTRVCAPSSGPEPDFSGLSKDDIVDPVDADILEGSDFELFDVPTTGTSGFTHFLDGAQRHWRAAYAGLFPIRIAHTSAALLSRTDGLIAAPDDSTYRWSFELFAPLGWQGSEAVQQEIRVTPVPYDETESPFAVQLRIQEMIEKRRADQESELAQSFTGECLLIDGGIGEVLQALSGQTVVGLVKSHQRQYFRSPERRNLILTMRAGQRSSVFLRPSSRKQGDKAFSFYLKMRDGIHEPPMFGLARVELPAQDRYLALADEIAGWILHERSPLSLPDPRFHVLPYPIHLVEEHLKARQPTDAAIRGMIGI